MASAKATTNKAKKKDVIKRATFKKATKPPKGIPIPPKPEKMSTAFKTKSGAKQVLKKFGVPGKIIAGVLAVFKRLAEIKLLIIDKLHQVESIGTFVKDGDGYKVTNPEGFVAIGHDGNAVKLVDRLEFSKQNFANTQAWKK